MPSAVHHANAYNMKLKFKCVNVNSIPAVNKQHERTSSTPEGFGMDALACMSFHGNQGAIRKIEKR